MASLLAADEVVTRVSAGAYHSVALTSAGRVLTWGNNAKGQLGRAGPPSATTSSPAASASSGASESGSGGSSSKLMPVEIELWYSMPGLIPGMEDLQQHLLIFIGAFQ